MCPRCCILFLSHTPRAQPHHHHHHQPHHPPHPPISQWSLCKGQRAPVSGTIHSCKQNVRKPHVVIPTTHTNTHTHTYKLFAVIWQRAAAWILCRLPLSLLHTHTYTRRDRQGFLFVPFSPLKYESSFFKAHTADYDDEVFLICWLKFSPLTPTLQNNTNSFDTAVPNTQFYFCTFVLLYSVK